MTKNVNVRFDEEMHASLVAAAKRNRRSLQAQIEQFCEDGLAMERLRTEKIPGVGLTAAEFITKATGHGPADTTGEQS